MLPIPYVTSKAAKTTIFYFNLDSEFPINIHDAIICDLCDYSFLFLLFTINLFFIEIYA